MTDQELTNKHNAAYPLEALVQKLKDGTLSQEERDLMAQAFLQLKTGQEGLMLARSYGGTVVLSGYAPGKSSEAGDTPLFFVIAHDAPSPQLWEEIQRLISEEQAREEEEEA